MENLKFVYNNSKGYVAKIVVYFLLCIFAWVISISMPYLMGQFIDGLVYTKTLQVIIRFVLIIVTFSVLDVIITYIVTMLAVNFKTRIVYNINYRLIEYVKHLPLEFFDKVDSTYLNQRINQDSNQIVNFVYDNIFGFLVNIFTVIGLVVVIGRINFGVLVILLIIIPSYIICYYVFKPKLYNNSLELKENQNKFFARMNEQFKVVKQIKINVWFDEFGKRMDEKFEFVFKSTLKSTKTTFLYNNFLKIFRSLCTTFLIAYGGYEILNGKMTVGNFTMINSYLLMLLDTTGFYLKFGQYWQENLVCWNRINEILNIPKDINGVKRINQINKIKISKLNFSYSNDNEIIKDFSYELTKGNIYGIVGSNGIGKSTLIDLIAGLRYSYEGHIFYDEYNIKDLDMYFIRKNLISFVEQEPLLLQDSISNNITFGIDKYDNVYYEELCEKFKIKDLLSSKINGNIMVSENNSNISGGEKQKISIIKSLLKNPEILILDEPISALDTNSIQVLKEKLSDIKESKIIIVVSHNNKIMDIVDNVIQL